jgi:Ni,Fe-hydrogenase III large subunit
MVDDFRKTTDVEVPKRAQYLRVIVMELDNYGSNHVIPFRVDTGATISL